MNDSPPRSSRTVLLFLLFQGLYGLTSSGNVFRAPDEFEPYFQAEHLADAGDISVPQTLAITQRKIRDGRIVGREPVFFGTFGVDRKPYAPYGPLVAILALPHHLLGRVVASAAGVPRRPLPGGIAWLMVVGGMTMLATATAGALAVAGFHRAVLTLGAGEREALVLSMLLGGCTALWPYGTSFFSEAFQAAAFAWAAALLLRGDRSGVIVASLLIAVAGLTKVTGLVFAPAFVAAILADERAPRTARLQSAIAVSVAIGTAAGIHLAWNTYRFGDPFNFGYDWSETIPQLPARAFVVGDIPRGLVVLLASPGKSIFLWAPPLILAAAGLRAFWRLHRGAAVGVVTAAAAGLLFFAAYLFPEGGYSHGPRNLVPVLPLLLLPATAAAVSRRWSLTAACAAVGFLVSFAATSVSYMEDQNIGADLAAGSSNYYERVNPAPGRPFNRYRLGYVPFAMTFASPGWFRSPTLGQGPDYFPLHLLQAKRQLADGSTIPLWLIAAVPAVWITLLIGSALVLYRR